MSRDPRYSDEVRRLFEATPRAGRPPPDEGWVQGEAREPLTGTHVRWHLRAADGRIVDARYEVRGCPHTIAAAALVADRLVGQAVAGVDADPAAAAAELDVPAEKLGRLFVIQDAVRRAALLLRRVRA
jgi:NifU-like protein involved in Fe-S cluster formation